MPGSTDYVKSHEKKVIIQFCAVTSAVGRHLTEDGGDSPERTRLTLGSPKRHKWITLFSLLPLQMSRGAGHELVDGVKRRLTAVSLPLFQFHVNRVDICQY